MEGDTGEGLKGKGCGEGGGGKGAVKKGMCGGG